jgi:F-type H+-transporting ATPase subunit b
MQLLTPEFGLIIWTLLAFLIVLYILGKFAWPAIMKGLKDREKIIADSLATAERVKAEMKLLKSENEELLAQAREERALMLKEARQTKDKIISEARDQARLEASKILSEASVAIENQKMAAITDVKNQIGNMVIDVAEKVIRRELERKEKQERYIRQLADDLTRNPSN